MITRVRGGGEIELRAFALTDMVKWGYDSLRNLAPAVSERDARGVPALYRAARLRAEALGELRLCCYRGYDADREKIESAWQSRLFAQPPNYYQTRFGFWETVGESLAWRGNAYVWKNTDPLSGQVIEWFALHPDQVTCKPDGSYEVVVRDGYMDPVGRGEGKYFVDAATVMHIRGHGDGGMLEAPSPIKLFRDALAAPVERQRHEAKMWRRGTNLQHAVIFPPGISLDQTRQWKEGWQAGFEGTGGSTTAVLGGGAELKPIGMTVADSEFVQMAHLTVEDAARIMGVPANLLGAATMTSEQTPSLEDDLAAWLRFGLGPELCRIENTLAADTTLFSPLGRAIYPAFDTDMFVRGDLKTESDILVSEVQAGVLLPDEARQIRGLPPLPNGAGKIPQITPVGGAPNPAAASSNGKTPVAA